MRRCAKAACTATAAPGFYVADDMHVDRLAERRHGGNDQADSGKQPPKAEIFADRKSNAQDATAEKKAVRTHPRRCARRRLIVDELGSFQDSTHSTHTRTCALNTVSTRKFEFKSFNGKNQFFVRSYMTLSRTYPFLAARMYVAPEPAPISAEERSCVQLQRWRDQSCALRSRQGPASGPVLHAMYPTPLCLACS